MTTTQKPKTRLPYQNPIETVKSSSSGRAPSREDFDLLALQRAYQERQQSQQKLPKRQEFTVFSQKEHYESSVRPQEITQLMNEVRREVADIKAHNQSMISEVEEVERNTLQSVPDKPGLYHIHFLELILQFLRGLKRKVGEANTWLEAMQSKRAKRGSAFSARSKKRGTQYSMSQELQTARNVM